MHYEFMYGDNKIQVPVYKEQKVLWSGAWYMSGNQTITLTSGISDQTHGICLIFSRYDSSVGAREYDWNMQFIPKNFLNAPGARGVTCFMLSSNASVCATKYIYMTDSKTIAGNDINDDSNVTASTGLKLNNNLFVLRYVIGV